MAKAIRSRIFPCHISARSSGVQKMIHRSAQLRGGDWATPQSFRCMSCGTRWDASDIAQANPRAVVCSNCYGERIEIVSLKVERVNWKEVMKEADHA